MKYLITGANGQLATEFKKVLSSNASIEVLSLSKDKLNIADAGSVYDLVSSYKPDVIINCAAYNNVDGAETDFNTALNVNGDGVANLARAANNVGALIVHYSTDYVFDGNKEDFYNENDMTNPISKYGESKLAGERSLINETENYLLFRVSWIFGDGRQNFLHKLLEWSQKNKKLKIVFDQVSVPTYTEDIVKITRRAIDKGVCGVFHLTNSGYASRYEVARYFFEHLGRDNLLLPVSSEYFKTPARRPYFSAMSNKKISKILDVEIPHWKDAIDRYVKKYITFNNEKTYFIFPLIE